jgi:hypothetical protein
MSDYSVTIDLPDHKRGDPWIGIARIWPILVDDLTPSGDLTRVRMQFRDNRGQVYRIDSDATAERDAPAVIDDAATWQASIPRIADFVPTAGFWYWDIEIWGDGDLYLTPYKGTLTVHDDVTR